MKKLFISFIATFFLFVSASYAELPPEAQGKPVPSLAPMLKRIMPAVVNISVVGEIKYPVNPFAEPSKRPQYNYPPTTPWSQRQRREKRPIQPPSKFQSLGSGVIVDTQKGYIVTNAHVLRDAKTITVTLNDGRQFKGKLVGQDTASDIAVIQIHAKNLHSLAFANSDNLNVGDFVVAIGNPFGLKQTVTSGIVSALQRNGLGIEGYENFIQTDAPINPGNSGGALVNLKGQLVGINTAILAPDGGNIGIGFAIPANMVDSVIKQLEKYGAVHHGRVGIMIQNLTPGLAQAFGFPQSESGAVVTYVNHFSPAEKAGLKAGDVIQKVNDKVVKNAGEVTSIVGLLRAGTDVKMQILRGNKTFNIDVITASTKQYEKLTQERNPFLYGMNFNNFNRYSTTHGEVQGVQVTNLTKNSPAAHAIPIGVRPGDVIVSANNKPVKNIAELEKIAKASKDQLLLNIYRGSGAMFVVVK
ncbi:MAG: DegQ family serine endoprotease [Pseudomonadota bacterium]